MDTLILANGVFDLGNDLANQTDNLVKTVLGVVGIIIGCVIIFGNPTIGRTILGVVVGGIIMALPWIMPSVSEMLKNDLDASVVVQEHVFEDQALNEGLEL